MSPDAIKLRIVEEIKARAYDDKYIDRNEEREIVRLAIELGVTVEAALAALNQVCDEYAYVLESRIVRQVADQLATTAGGGRLTRAEFDAVCDTTQRAVDGKKSARDVQKMVVQVMEATGHNRVKTGWLTNWYAALKKELGV